MPSLLLALALVSVAGCGFQLRGAIALPPELERLHLAGEALSPEFRDELRSALRGAGVAISDELAPGIPVLRVLAINSDRRVLSVASTGKVQEYELRYEVRFSVQRADGAPVLEPQTVQQTRDFRFEQTEVLGKSEEQDQLLAEMRRDVVGLMLSRLSSQLR